MNKQHESLVARQFGPRASAYVESDVHARGADLDQAVELLRGRSGARALDLGCGGGHVCFNVAPLVHEVTAYDLAPEMLAAVAQAAAERGLTNIVTRKGAAEYLPFDDASFDFVLSRYSAHHWRGFDKALSEACRVLRPDGTALFMDAVSPGIALLDTYLQAVELLRDHSHVRDYTIEEWNLVLNAAGFMIQSVAKRRVRLQFATWIARMRTPPIQAEAIRALQTNMAEEVEEHFEIEADGSFTIDTATIEVRRQACA